MKHVHPVSIPLMAFLARVKGFVEEPKAQPVDPPAPAPDPTPAG